ncbi:hypothetical protein Ocin01_16027 [Orchesella cincta]|uniref:F-box domain-containing protein n=1 Tax=Orchesella cincta TaxID=48709 RepID=A0A1D2MCD2_ORCCI|nr:hypothetical protein Ocin01_16027 [Orchesella cincta]
MGWYTHENDQIDDIPDPNASQVSVSIDYDYFCPALMDCWPVILSYVTKRHDLRALTNTCRLFQDMLHARKMSKLVIPILMKNPCFGKSGILSCRLLNQEIKHNVDKFLRQTQPSWLKESFDLKEPSRYQQFIEFAQSVNGKSTFISKQLNIQMLDLECFDLAMILFQQHGHLIKELRLGIFHSMLPSPIAQALIQALSLLSEVEKLDLSFLNFDHLGPNDNLDQVEEEWNLFDGILVNSLPKLSALVELTLTVDCSNSFNLCLPLAGVVDPVLRMYGPQLSKLTCSESSFALDVDVGLLNSHLTNLRKLEIPSLASNDADLVFQKLSQVTWPNLESLSLGRQLGGVQFTVYYAAHALANFRNSLKELRLGAMHGEGAYLCGVNPVYIYTFPRLTKLVVCSSDIYNGIWHVFRFHFINLEYLRFEQMNGEVVPIPYYNELKDYFIMFPKLKKLTWVDGIGNGVYCVTFTRMLLLGE